MIGMWIKNFNETNLSLTNLVIQSQTSPNPNTEKNPHRHSHNMASIGNPNLAIVFNGNLPPCVFPYNHWVGVVNWGNRLWCCSFLSALGTLDSTRLFWSNYVGMRDNLTMIILIHISNYFVPRVFNFKNILILSKSYTTSTLCLATYGNNLT